MMYTTYYIQYNDRITQLSKYRKYIAKNTLKIYTAYRIYKFHLNVPGILVDYFTKDLNKVELS